MMLARNTGRTEAAEGMEKSGSGKIMDHSGRPAR
jgi:hypothetical protein